MKKEFEKELRNKRNILKGIGILEIIGGIAGVGAILLMILLGIEMSTSTLLILLVTTGFYIYSIYAGMKLFKNKEKGIFHSRILQYLQMISFSFGGTTYLLTSGGFFFLGLNLSSLNIEFEFSIIDSKFQMYLMNSEINNYIYINLFAIFILFLIDKSTKEIFEQEDMKLKDEQKTNEYLATGNGNEE